MVRQGIIFKKTHELDKDERRAIYVIRDGREACLSYWHYVTDVGGDTCSLQHIIRENKTRFGTWSAHVEGWMPSDRPGTLFLRYEDMRDRLSMVLRSLEGFIGMSAYSEELPPFEHFRALDPKFFRAGRTSSWQDELSNDERDLFWDIHGGTMERYGYGQQVARRAVATR